MQNKSGRPHLISATECLTRAMQFFYKTNLVTTEDVKRYYTGPRHRDREIVMALIGDMALQGDILDACSRLIQDRGLISLNSRIGHMREPKILNLRLGDYMIMRGFRDEYELSDNIGVDLLILEKALRGKKMNAEDIQTIKTATNGWVDLEKPDEVILMRSAEKDRRGGR